MEASDGSQFHLYVGESSNGLRRMWDLPIGESHHVASRFPPEAWSRVIVVQWPQLIGGLSPSEGVDLDLSNAKAAKAVNKFLEERLNYETSPLFDGRRTKDGTFRKRKRKAPETGPFCTLSDAVMTAWRQLQTVALSRDRPWRSTDYGFALSPSMLLLGENLIDGSPLPTS
jgi:hypothetical protein